MRQLKFRAWDKATNRMFPVFELFSEVTRYDLVYRWAMEQRFEKGCDERMSDVVVMQFTGLHDKQGREIYEGDIVRIYCGQAPETFEDKAVRFNTDTTAFTLADWRMNLDYPIEIIGNIYENPNLLDLPPEPKHRKD